VVLLVMWGVFSVVSVFALMVGMEGFSSWDGLGAAERTERMASGLALAAPWALGAALFLVMYVVMYRWDQERARRAVPSAMWWPPGTGRQSSSPAENPVEPMEAGQERRVARHDSWS
jgi:hypothetical protein